MNEVLRTSGRRYATSASTAGRSRIAATTSHVPSPGSGGPPGQRHQRYGIDGLPVRLGPGGLRRHGLRGAAFRTCRPPAGRRSS